MDAELTGLAAALGIGLLIGVEREYSQQSSNLVTVAGTRTFALVALLGGLSALLASEWLLVAGALIVGGIVALSYRITHQQDPGITTEFSLVIVYLLGALALTRTPLAIGLGVVVAVLLHSRSWLHDWVRNRLTAHEINDALLLAAAALVILPLIPDRTVDPWQVLNPRTLWLLAVLFMTVNGVGYIARRTFGAGYGLAIAGLAAGFVSSSATHAAMGARARAHPGQLGAAVAGAALSSVATVVQLAIVVGVTSLPLLRDLGWALLGAGAVAAGYGVAFTWRSLRSGQLDDGSTGRAFRPATALGFALLMSAVIVMAAVLVRWLGPQGALLTSAVAGFADTHASAASAGSLLAGGAIERSTAVAAVLLGLTTNAVTKAVMAGWTGGWAFLGMLLPGLALMVAVAWLGTLI